MCEFCSLPIGGDRDRNHKDFEGFFSAALIEAAVKQANADRKKKGEQQEDVEGDDESDGT